MGGDKPKMVMLMANNYAIWKTKMLDRLYVKMLARPIEELGIRPPDANVREWSELDRRCLGYIRDYIDIGVIHHVENTTTAFGCWTKLQGLYERKTSGHKVSLVRQLGKLRYVDGTSLTEHLNQLEHIFNQLTAMGVDFNDEVQALWILGSLPDSWETLSVSLSASAPDGTISKEMVSNTILNEELRRGGGLDNGHGGSNNDMLVYEHKKGKKKHTKVHPGKSKSSKKEDQCHYCNKLGHSKSECYSFKKDVANRSVKNKKNENNNVAIVNPSGDLIVVGSSDVCYASSGDDWVIDSGASFHVTPHKSFFMTYKQGDLGEARMGNNGVSEIKEICDICLKSDRGSEIILKDVRHIPDFRLNLISSGKLDDQGFFNFFGEGKWKLIRDSKLIVQGVKEGTLYRSRLVALNNAVHVVEPKIDLWHNRLGHMSGKGLKILSKRDLIPRFEDTHVSSCTHCLMGKQHRVSFNKSAQRKGKVLELIYSDVCGFMETRTLGGCSYFVTFIDDHSRKLWAYPLKTKDQVINVFKQLHVLVERELASISSVFGPTMEGNTLELLIFIARSMVFDMSKVCPRLLNTMV
ncbi:hypothetical protein LIER_06020 [Lithospermum erythrorhizon]|uniref:Retrovirus-related Pol polyprotein from transposon TNT 1-94 n=1 Tax=Lithospermum erythrorhizon TaxID=34254 RepID=A0AAV3P7D3_LITER